MKRYSARRDKKGRVRMVEDPNGQWEMVLDPIPDSPIRNQTIKVDKLPPDYIIGIDPYSADDKPSDCVIYQDGKLAHPNKKTDEREDPSL